MFEFIRIPGYTPDAERRDPTSVADSERQANDPRSRVFVLYLASTGMTIEGLREARTLGGQFLRRTLGPADLVGIMTSEMTIDQLTLSRRLEVAEAAMAEYWHERLTEAYANDPLEPRTQYEQFLHDCYAAKGQYAIGAVLGAARSEQFLNTLSGTALKLGSLRDQRSNLVLFAGALPLGSSAGVLQYAWKTGQQVGVGPTGRGSFGPPPDPRGAPRNAGSCDAELARLAALDRQDMFRSLMDTARRSNVVVHVVDPSGMSIYDDLGLQNSKQGQPRVDAKPTWNRSGAMRESLRTLAANTDGEAILATNNVRDLMARMAENLSAYYLLGYYSTNAQFDGKYREIDVRVRRPGVKVSARKGYLAPSADIVRAADAARDRIAAPARVEPTEFDTLVSALEADSRADVSVRGVVQGNELVVVAEARGPAIGGRVPDGARVSIRALTGDAAIGYLDEALPPMVRSMLARFPIPSGNAGPFRLEVRVVTVDGPVTTRVNAFGRGSVLNEPVVYRAAASQRANFAPTASLTFSRTERIRLEWRVTAPLENPQARLLGRNGAPLSIPVSVTEFERAGQRVLAADLTLSPLGTGDYFLEVTVAAGGRSGRSLSAFRIR
ncbi:MAG TPA: VWA domain-containing protein, partial [Vicinamibacterales bacterium]|nr:VWA domain-containing protein [Vicinamibacterales bacterium]